MVQLAKIRLLLLLLLILSGCKKKLTDLENEAIDEFEFQRDEMLMDYCPFQGPVLLKNKENDFAEFGFYYNHRVDTFWIKVITYYSSRRPSLILCHHFEILRNNWKIYEKEKNSLKN